MCNTCYQSCNSCNSCNTCGSCSFGSGLLNFLFGNSRSCGCGCGCAAARNAAIAMRDDIARFTTIA